MLNLGGASNLRRGGLLACAAAIGVASACGGTAIIDDPAGKAGATSVAGGTSLAGASPTAGSSGSSADPACTADQDPGTCEAYFPAFWHNPKTGLCVPFVYGGCGGNANRYPSRDACLQACPKADDDWGECVDDKTCTMVQSSCCEQCDPITSDQLVAVNSAHLPYYGGSHCSGSYDCPVCTYVPETKQTKKYFKPVCRNRQCTLIDIRETPLTACQKHSDCVLRNGISCCEECDPIGWVALNKNADLCGGAPIGCDPCVSLLPSLVAVCVSGTCQLAEPI